MIKYCFLLFYLLILSVITHAQNLKDIYNTSGGFHFNHPGLLNSASELAFINAKIKAGQQPWADLFNHLKNVTG